MVIKETRLMSKLRLRQLCIDRDWFTRGTNDEYTRLFEMAGDYDTHIGAYTLYDMAVWIMAHSSDEALEDVEITDIMAALARICRTTYEITYD